MPFYFATSSRVFVAGVVDLFNGNSADGSLTLYAQGNGMRSALDIGPTRGTQVTNNNPKAEVVLYQTTDQATNFERMSWTAMEYTAGDEFVFQTEQGGTGSYRDTRWSFIGRADASDEFLRFKSTQVGSSVPIEIVHAHLAFTVASMGGAGSTYYIARGGGRTFGINVPTSARFDILVNNANILQINATTLTFAESLDFVFGTTTGTKIGTETTQKLGFWNATPVIQGAAVADASGGATVDSQARTAINTLLARIRTYGLIAT